MQSLQRLQRQTALTSSATRRNLFSISPVGVSRRQFTGSSVLGASFGAQPQHAAKLAQPPAASKGDALPSEADAALLPAAGTLRNVSFVSFWLQLALSISSAAVLFFSIAVTGGSNSGAAAGIKYFTMAGIALSFISTFFAHGFNTLARKLSAGEAVSRQWLQGSLLSNSALNLWGIGATVIGLQAAVGTLVGKTLMTSASAVFVGPPAGQLISLDVFALQSATNTILAHFASLVAVNIMLGRVNRAQPQPAAA